MIVRSLHAGKPFVVARRCVELPGHSGGYRLCGGQGLLLVIEPDRGEVFDITLYRTLAALAEPGEHIPSAVVRALAGAMERFSVPDAHAAIANYLYVEPLPGAPSPPITDPWGYIAKPAVIARISPTAYAAILRESREPPDYIERLTSHADTLLATIYLVETLPHLLRRHRRTAAHILHRLHNIPPEATERAILEAYASTPPTIHDMAHDTALRLAARGYIHEKQTQSVEHTLTELTYRLVEQGAYEPPRLLAAALYRRGKLQATGCRALEEARNTLPERETKIYKKLCNEKRRNRRQDKIIA